MLKITIRNNSIRDIEFVEMSYTSKYMKIIFDDKIIASTHCTDFIGYQKLRIYEGFNPLNVLKHSYLGYVRTLHYGNEYHYVYAIILPEVIENKTIREYTKLLADKLVKLEKNVLISFNYGLRKNYRSKLIFSLLKKDGDPNVNEDIVTYEGLRGLKKALKDLEKY